MSAMLLYDTEKFVNREEEINLVINSIQHMRDGQEHVARTVIFQGERGSGKSWLSFHLKRQILPALTDVTALLVSLFPRPEQQQAQPGELFISDHQQEPEAFTRQITRWVGEQVSANVPANASLRELTAWLAREVEKQSNSAHVLVLIIDSVFEADWQLLKALEDYLLAPLAALPNVLIVMTGRGRLYSWESPYLRVDVNRHPLDTFTLEQIRQQLQRQAPGKEQLAGDILALASGYPGANVLLAQFKDESGGLNQVVNELLSVIPEHKLAHVRPYLEALCILDGFRDEEIPAMVAAYQNDPALEKQTSTTDARSIRSMLLETHLVRWEDGRYRIDQPICLLLRSLLFEQKPAIWCRLQCRAYQLYLTWAEKFARGRDYFLERATLHANTLSAAGYDPADCLNGPESAGLAQNTDRSRVSLGI